MNHSYSEFLSRQKENALYHFILSPYIFFSNARQRFLATTALHGYQYQYATAAASGRVQKSPVNLKIRHQSQLFLGCCVIPAGARVHPKSEVTLPIHAPSATVKTLHF
jgi:hypothetical protein